MGTGYNAIGLALRDVGQGVGNLLTDVATRRRDALAEQKETHRLSLAQAQLVNEAQVAEAKGQVGLAEVASKGRQFEAQQALKEREVKQQGRYYEGQLEAEKARQKLAERKLTEVDIPAQQATAAAQRSQAAASATQAQASLLQARSSERYHASLAAKVDQEVAEGKRPVYLEDIFKHFDTTFTQAYGDRGAQYSQMLRGLAELYAGSPDTWPKDQQGRPYVTANVAGKIEKDIKPVWDAIMTQEKANAKYTPAQRDELLLKQYGAFSKEFQEAHPWEQWYPTAAAMLHDHVTYTAGLQHVDGDLKAAQQRLEAQFATQHRLPTTYKGGSPARDPKDPLAMAYQVEVADPLATLRKDWTRQSAFDVLGNTSTVPHDAGSPRPERTPTGAGAPPPGGGTPPPPPAPAPPPAVVPPAAAAPPAAAPPPPGLASAATRAQQLQQRQQTLGGLLERQPHTLGGAILGTSSVTPPPPAVTQAVEAVVGNAAFADVPAFRQTQAAQNLLRNAGIGALPDGVHYVPLANGDVWRMTVVRGQVGNFSLIGGGGSPATPPPATESRGSQPAGGQ